MRYLLPIIAVALLSVGCATSTAPAPTVGTVEYNRETQKLVQRVRVAAVAGTQIYVEKRNQIDLDDRELVRQLYIGLRNVARLHTVDGTISARDLLLNIAEEVAMRVEDPAYKIAVLFAVNEIVIQMDDRIDLDASDLTESRAWLILAAAEDGIAQVLAVNGIDPNVPVNPATEAM